LLKREGTVAYRKEGTTVECPLYCKYRGFGVMNKTVGRRKMFITIANEAS